MAGGGVSGPIAICCTCYEVLVPPQAARINNPAKAEKFASHNLNFENKFRPKYVIYAVKLWKALAAGQL
jgi:hypothetical protein